LGILLPLVIVLALVAVLALVIVLVLVMVLPLIIVLVLVMVIPLHEWYRLRCRSIFALFGGNVAGMEPVRHPTSGAAGSFPGHRRLA